jgi:hypothetical protein
MKEGSVQCSTGLRHEGSDLVASCHSWRYYFVFQASALIRILEVKDF